MSTPPSTTSEPTLAAAAAKADAPSRGRVLFERLFGVDLRALALFRIGLAILVLGDFWIRLQDIESHYTEFGVAPREAIIKFNQGSLWSYLSPYMWTGWVQDFLGWTEVTQIGLLFGATALAALMMLVGYRTRMATVLTWLLVCAVHTRNPMVLHGGDLFTRMMLFWAMFVPTGARFSLDGGVAILRAYEAKAPVRVATLGTAGLLLQIAFVYWFTVSLKHGAAWRTEFSAVYYALNIDHYGTPFGRFLLGLPALLPVMSFGTIVWEALGPVLAFSPWRTELFRTIAALGFIFFHLIALNLALDLGSFPYVASVAWFAFLPTSLLDALTRGWRQAPAWAGKRTLDKVREKVTALRDRSIAARVRHGVPLPRFDRMSRTGAVFAVLFVLYILVFNLRSVNKKLWERVLPPSTDVLTNFTRTDQMWGMFSPFPMTDDGWYVMPAQTMDGTSFDIFTSSAPIHYQKPAFVAGMYKNERWRKYLMNLWNQVDPIQRSYYASYLCRNWNRWHKGTQELYGLKIIYMKEDTLPKKIATPKPVVVWQHWCREDIARKNIEEVRKSLRKTAEEQARMQAIKSGLKNYDRVKKEQAERFREIEKQRQGKTGAGSSQRQQAGEPKSAEQQ